MVNSNDKLYSCSHCKTGFNTIQARNGHKAHCKERKKRQKGFLKSNFKTSAGATPAKRSQRKVTFSLEESSSIQDFETPGVSRMAVEEQTEVDAQEDAGNSDDSMYTSDNDNNNYMSFSQSVASAHANSGTVNQATSAIPQSTRPKQYFDILPSNHNLIPAEGFDDNSVPFQTKPDAFGMYRVYPLGKPSYSPDSLFTLSHLTDSPTLDAVDIICSSTSPLDSDDNTPLSHTPSNTSIPAFTQIFGNESRGLFMHWYHTGNSALGSKARADSLLKDVIQNPLFKKEDMLDFRMDKGLQQLDRVLKSSTGLPLQDSWMNNATVEISVPCDGVKHHSESDAPKFAVHDIQYRKLIDVIKSALSEPAAEFFHISGFESYQMPSAPGESPTRYYDEIYSSPAFLEEQERVTRQARAEGCTMEVVVIAMLSGSDLTRLADFGAQYLWPIYLYFGNLSKYIRTKPITMSAHHIAYIPKLPDDVQEWYKATFGVYATRETLTHLRRELFHSIWSLLLDDEFCAAYRHGFDVVFWDTKIRRVYPRVFTHSMDYLEKILFTCIKNLAECLCPECLVKKSDVHLLGTLRDMKNRELTARVDDESTQTSIAKAREAIYEQGKSFTSTSVTKHLVSKSLHPTRVLINQRYRSTPTFGRDTIRRFRKNASSMTKYGARDFEDLLQCAIPAFNGLIVGPDGTFIRQFLFELATWHALAKLRRHTNQTIVELEASTFRLGQGLRRFRKVTLGYNTRDLPQEENARAPKTRSTKRDSQKVRRFNLHTFKIHALGHHVHYIKLMDTTDNYSKQITEVEHKRVKRHAKRASKSSALLASGISKQQWRERVLYQVVQSQKYAVLKSRAQNIKGKSTVDPRLAFLAPKQLPRTDPSIHHDMSHEENRNNRINLLDWTQANNDDPALKGFIRRLRGHLLARLLNVEYDDDITQFSPQELNRLIIDKNNIYQHQALRVNYTTYDLRRGQDSLNPQTHPFIMLLSNDGSQHPYWYAQILGIFHVNVLFQTTTQSKPVPHVMEVIWVRWLGLNTYSSYGWKAKNLPQVGFIDIAVDDSPGFGFINPTQIIRAVHLIPDQSKGKSSNGLFYPTSLARQYTDDKELDWNYFFVNFFVDRDMFMRYRGGSVGHLAVRGAVDHFLNDRDEIDYRYIQRQEVGAEEGVHEDVEGIEEMEDDDDIGSDDTDSCCSDLDITETISEQDSEDNSDENFDDDDKDLYLDEALGHVDILAEYGLADM
ncbi:hypothetical protein CVT24_001550 [Panaeolus cyanescens]|uniref:Uncharacterized protein n=1 Tax=Panaeolus cyanescens TaxID=181874 RepID=A0A409YU83_9AGAR|nr:hypothetical protein CVT24_001550 [Panaeolus cyanescens]